MWRVVLALCAAEVLTMVSVFAFPALLPTFIAEWSLSNTEAGWISGVYFAGYTLAVPVLMSLTDRLDAKRIYLFGTAAAAVSGFGFAALADGFWTAMAFRFVGGIGLAGTYMPGLKALVDRVEGPIQARAISFYTASFSLGTSLSFLVIGEVAAREGWRTAFALAAGGAAAAFLVALTLKPAAVHPPAEPTPLLDFRPVFRNRPAMGYVFGYLVHCWELFGLRSWMVAFLVFVQTAQGAQDGWSPTSVATLSALVAMVTSIVGADIAARGDRPRIIALFMTFSGLAALAIGFTAPLPYALVALLCLVYSGLVQLDSAALTTGAVQAAEHGRRGATIAVHTLLGFSAAFLGPLAVGVVLDLTGGGATAASWGLAFASMGAVVMLGPLALAWSRRLP